MPEYAGLIKFPVAADRYNTAYGEQQWWRDIAMTTHAEIGKQVSDAASIDYAPAIAALNAAAQ